MVRTLAPRMVIALAAVIATTAPARADDGDADKLAGTTTGVETDAPGGTTALDGRLGGNGARAVVGTTGSS